MSNEQTDKKLDKLAINKETVRDLDANNADDVKAGGTINQAVTSKIRCHIEPKTANGNRCENVPTVNVNCG